MEAVGIAISVVGGMAGSIFLEVHHIKSPAWPTVVGIVAAAFIWVAAGLRDKWID